MEQKNKWERGSGETLGFAVIVVCFSAILILLASFLQLSFGLNSITKAATSSSRAGAVCMSFDDAKQQIQKVAESSITNPLLSNIQTNLEYATPNEEWTSGNLVRVTVSADVKANAPFRTGKREKSVLVAIENTKGNAVVLPPEMGTQYTYMAWEMITAISSNQYKLIMKAGGRQFDENGFGKIDGRYVIACTPIFGRVGDYIDFYLENGNIIHTIVGDQKRLSDANANAYGHDHGKSVVEFVVQETKWYDQGHYPTDFHPEWDSRVIKGVNLNRNYLES